jgi:glyoxylase I family protein
MRNVSERSLSSAGKTNGNNMLKHICPLLQVNDLRASLMFYGEKLGFQTGSADDGFSVVRRDDCTLYLAQKTKVADVTNRAARADPDDGWCNYDIHFYCEPGTLDALFQEFRSKGVLMPDCFKHGPVKRSYGVRDFSVIDPDGYDLVFGEECSDDE